MPDLTCALGPDSAGTVLTTRLEDARHSIDAALYEVGPSYRWQLVRAAERGLAVRLLLDAHGSDGNGGTATALTTAGGACRVLGAQGSAAHWKFMVLDGREVAVGTGNLIRRDAPRDPRHRLPPDAPPLAGTREWWAVVRGHGWARDARHRFDDAWRRAAPPPTRWRELPAIAPQAMVGTPVPQVPPLHRHVRGRRATTVWGGEAIAAVVRELGRDARRRLLATVPYAHARVPQVAAVLACMRSAAQRGVDVRLLIGGVPQARDVSALAGTGLPVRVMDPARSTRGHAKGVVADRAVLIASANWSANGLTGEWEAALLLRDDPSSAYYAAAFERDWACAAAL